MSLDQLLQLGKDYLAGGGFIMPPLLIAGALLWYGLGYRMVTLRRGSRKSLRRLLEEPHAGNGIITRAVRQGVRVIARPGPSLRGRIDESMAEIEDDAAKFGVMVKTIVMLAPLAGLLGTVTGMIETFDSLADMALFAQSGGVAGGISQALFSTQLGLAVAVPGLIIGRLLSRREDALLMEVSELKDALMNESRRRGYAHQ